MYELSIAAKYLIPRWKQLSVSIISMVSVLVITVVVWLVVVFFSVTNGLTSSWIDKLIALTAPVRIVPTSHYYHSYFYLADSISEASDYNLKTLAEKLHAADSDPYNPESDEELPFNWPAAELDSEGKLKDPVKTAFTAINSLKGIPGLSAGDYEMTIANLSLKLQREQSQNTLSQSSYVGSLDPENPRLLNAIKQPSMADLSNLLASLAQRFNESSDEQPGLIQLEDKEIVQKRLKAFFSHVTIRKLIVPEKGWRLPRELLPQNAVWDVTLVKRNNYLQRIIVNQETGRAAGQQSINGLTLEPGKLKVEDNQLVLISPDAGATPIPAYAQLYLSPGSVIDAELIESSLSDAHDSTALKFNMQIPVQGQTLSGSASYGFLQIAKASINTHFSSEPRYSPFWMYGLQTSKSEAVKLFLPTMEGLGEGVLLPKSFQASGVLAGDRGYLSYYAPSISSVQEQRIPVFVAGFYDPGIIPIGGKYVLTSKEITTLIRSFYDHEEAPFSNGINVRFESPDDADRVKNMLEKAFDEAGISPFWKIETFREYEFTRDIIQQLQSEKRLYTLLATLIIIVACSNIISMLIILVNDKKMEIGILRSMGATSFSIALIFGTCGVVMGAVGSLLGTLAAFITLKNIQPLVDFIGRMQGYEMFNPVFYGESLPSEISFEALSFVVATTAFISLVAGIIPAIKASLLKPSAILKAE